MDTSPFAPEKLAELAPMAGLRIGTAAAGIKTPGRRDVALLVFPEETVLAAGFTRSACAAAPVRWSQQVRGRVRALLVNAGNANAMTGSRGEADVKACAEQVASRVGCAPQEVFIASTGVIGEPLPMERMRYGIDVAAAALGDADARAFSNFAEAIMTTDTFPKLARYDGAGCVAQGVAKGSGMIAPSLATTLGFVFTDAAVSPEALSAGVKRALADSFESITVDGDLSTNDTVAVFALGGPATGAADRVDAACAAVLKDLALQVVGDGEGISKRIEIAVSGAATDADAKALAMSVANSPLFKTAMAGADANWGRVAMALGKAGVAFDQTQLDLAFGGMAVAEGGARIAGYDEAPVAAHLAGREIQLDVRVGSGPGAARVWTCDLTHGYISINADYRS